MQKLLLSILFILLAYGQIFAQKDPIKWGKVPAEDLAMTSYEKDPDAGAVVLCDFGKIYFDISARGAEYKYVRHKRVKILSRAGFDQADVEVPYSEGQIFSDFKAQVFSPDGSKVELNKKDLFEEKVTKYWNRQRFTFPNVQEGSVIEYRYTIASGNLFTLRQWYFQEDIPVRWSELRFNMIEYLYYSTVMSGSVDLVINEKGSGSKNIGGSPVPMTENRWAAEHVPALKVEDYVACPDDYRAKMRFQLVTMDIPGEFTQKVEWPQLTKGLLESQYFGDQYLKKRTTKDVLEQAAPVLAAAATPLEKAQAAYDFVNQNVKWNGRYWYDTFDDLDKVLAEGTGYSSELNLMVLALLRSQGIKAFPVIISTRSNGRVNPYYPLLAQFDHTLVRAEIDGQAYWVDAGDPLRPFGLPAVESLNWQGLLINDEEESFGWVEIKPTRSVEVVYVKASVDESGQLSGEMTCSFDGYGALQERKTCQGKSATQVWQNRLAGAFPEASVEGLDTENMAETSEKLKENMRVSLPEAGMVSGDMLYLSPTLYSNFSENPFKAEQRTLPVEFPYPFKEQLVTNIALPEGYLVEGLPEGIRLGLPEGAGSFTYRVTEQGGSIQVMSVLELKKTFFLPEEYDGLRNFFSLIEEKMGEQLVLKKKT